MLKLGEVKAPTDQDYEYIKELCRNEENWKLDYNKSNIKVWVKQNNLSVFNMIKAKVEFDDVVPERLFDVLLDGDYGKQWDDGMIDATTVCYISPCSDISYYAMKCPSPLKNRDFVIQRCWLDYGDGKEKIIYNHSVNHAKCPPKKNLVRAVSYITAAYIIPTSAKSSTLYYLTQSDPCGNLPSWVVNIASKSIIPKIIKKLHKSCLKYDKWKSKNNPNDKPWIDPEYIKVPKISLSDIGVIDLKDINNNSNADESAINENDFDKHALSDD